MFGVKLEDEEVDFGTTGPLPGLVAEPCRTGNLEVRNTIACLVF